MKIIEEGYKLPFQTIPVAAVLKNNNSATCHQQFVQEAIAELVLTGRMIQSQTTPHVANPLSVSIQANGKKRLILDLRYVNKCVDNKRVKYWKVALSYFEKDAYMFSFDSKSGYHHIEIHEDHQTFLGFAYKDRNYVFTVVPFGLSTAPYIFTKVLKPLEKHWRQNRISIAVFLDDGWWTEKDLSKCIGQSKTVRTDIVNAGFIQNDVKSIRTSTKIIIWLGLKWNSERGTFSITQRRI